MTTHPYYLAGEWRRTESTFEVHSPFDGRYVATVARPSSVEADEALERAAAAFPETRQLPTYRRADALMEIARQVEQRCDAIASIATAESGKPIKAARAEVAKSAGIFALAAEEAHRWGGEFSRADSSPAAEGRALLVRHMPRGPVLGITGFNFPFLLAAHKVAPAIAVGSPILLKPAITTPLTAFAMAEIIAATDLPPAMLSVLPLEPANTEPLVTDPRVKVISFTGSSKVGWKIRQQAFDKPVTLELGGAGPVIVHDDADLDHVAARVAAGGFGNSGQSCHSAQRILIQRDVYEAAAARIVARVQELVVGDPADPATDVGPLINREAAVRIEEWVSEAVALGAEVLVGGKRDDSVYYPTVVAHVPPTASLWCEEIFGPVVVLEPYDTFEEAIALANDSAYGLQAGVFTHDLARVLRAYEDLDVGAVIVNDTSAWRDNRMPFGGTKSSGTGREGLRYAMEDMCELKALALPNVHV